MPSLTVFIVGDGAPPTAVRTMVDSWTRAGITGRSIWVSPRDVTLSPSGPPVANASVVSVDGVQRVDLFAEIGRFRVDLVRVVAAHLVLQDGVTEPALDVIAAALADAIEATLPHRVDGSTGGTRLHRSLVVIPVSGAEGTPASVFKAEWDVNVVISPEDRPDIDRASVFVRHPGNFIGHAGAALCAIGGVLRGIDAGVLDDQATDSAAQEADAIVARVTVRSVTGEEAADAVADRVLDPTTFRTALPSEVLSWARPASEPDLIAASAAQYLLATPEWMASENQLPPMARRTQERFFQALWTAIRFNVRTVGAVLSWGLTRSRDHVERQVTEALVGSGGGSLVTLGPKPVEDVAVASERFIQNERSKIDHDFELEATRTIQPVPSTWSTLRTISFGLADGGDLAGFKEPRQAGRRELLPAEFVVPAVGSTWQTRAEGQIVRADDPVQMQAYRGEVERDKVGSAARVVEVEQELAQARQEFEEQKRRRPKEDRGDESSPQIRRLEASLQEAQGADTTMREELEGYAAWFNSHAKSLLWRVGDDIGSRLAELRTNRQGRVDGPAPTADGLKRGQRNLLLWWAIVSPTWLGLVLLTIWIASGLHLASWKEFVDAAKATAAWLLGFTAIAAILLISANHAFYKAVRRYDWMIEDYLHRLRRANAQHLYIGRETARLHVLYSGLKDWTRILGEFLYAPWGTAEAKYEDLPDDVIEALPASMGVAKQPKDEFEASPSVLVSTYSLVYRRGWCSQYFTTVYDEWEARQGSGPNEGYLSVDLDTTTNRLSPRSRFKQFWIDGAARDFATGGQRELLGRAARDGSLDVPNRVVRRLGRYGDELAILEPEFYRAAATESTSFAVDVFSPSGRQARRHYVERSVAWMPRGARASGRHGGVEVRDCDGPTAVRVDATGRLPAGDLAIFAQGVGVGRVDLFIPEAKVHAPVSGIEDGTSEFSWH